MTICYLINNNDIYLNRYHVNNIAVELQALGHKIIIVNERDFTELGYLQFDLLILVRITYQEALQSVLRALKVPIIYHIDDYIFNTSIVSSASSYKKMMEECTYITTSTEYLSKKVSEEFDKSKLLGIIPNTIGRFYQNAAKDFGPATLQGKIISYFSGTSTHDQDFLVVADALLSILQKDPSVTFLIVGALKVPLSFVSVYPSMTQYGILPYVSMLQMYKNSTVNLAPLILNEFNNCKSELKLFESGYLNVPTLASPTDPYSKYYEKTEFNYLCTTTKEWEEKISYLLYNESTSYSIWEESQELAQKFLVQNHIEHIEKLYDGVIS